MNGYGLDLVDYLEGGGGGGGGNSVFSVTKVTDFASICLRI